LSIEKRFYHINIQFFELFIGPPRDLLNFSPLSFSLTHTFTHSQALSISFTHTTIRSPSHKHTSTLVHTHSHTHTLSHTLTHSQTYKHTCTCSLSISFTHTFSLPLFGVDGSVSIDFRWTTEKTSIFTFPWHSIFHLQ
jgi:hypothetical protein